MLSVLSPENIGPSVFSGRVTDVDADPDNPSRMYVAYASGGLWYTESNGTQFKPVFDQEASMTIGDIAVNWSANTIWVGTGEANSSRSSYAGTGLYKVRMEVKPGFGAGCRKAIISGASCSTLPIRIQRG